MRTMKFESEEYFSEHERLFRRQKNKNTEENLRFKLRYMILTCLNKFFFQKQVKTFNNNKKTDIHTNIIFPSLIRLKVKLYGIINYV